MVRKACILALLYHEPSYIETLKSVSGLDNKRVPVFFADRGGVGNMAKAFNEAFGANHCKEFEYTWFLTNITFGSGMLNRLIEAADRQGLAAVSPSFASDHAHLRPRTGSPTKIFPVPFVEFTCPLVRSSVFDRHKLDEGMPYVGHDIDWGHRVRKEGGKIGCLAGAKVGHIYIRHTKQRGPVTNERARLRRLAQSGTINSLIRKYGPSWKQKLGYGSHGV